MKHITDKFKSDDSINRIIVYTSLIIVIIIVVMTYISADDGAIDLSGIEDDMFFANRTPQTNDFAAYIAYIFFTPIVSVIIAGIFVLIRQRYSSADHLIIKADKALFNITWVLLLMFALIFLINYDGLFLDRMPLNGVNGIFTLIVFLVAIRASSIKAVNKLLVYSMALMCVVMIAMTCYLMYLPPSHRNEVAPHYTAYVTSVHAVLHGRTLLVDFIPQYGLYAYFLAPIFRIVDLNINTFSIVMIFLQLVLSLCRYLTLRLLIRNELYRLLIFLNLLYICRFRSYIHGSINIEPFYMNFPGRILFPAVIMFLFVKYTTLIYRGKQDDEQTTGVKQGYGKLYGIVFFALLVIASMIGLLWNPETGIVCYAAAVVGLGYYAVCDNTTNRSVLKSVKAMCYDNWVRFAVYIFAVPAFALTFIYLVTFVRTGSLGIDLTRLFIGIDVYYTYGVNLMPMPHVHPWVYAMLAYLIGITLAASHFIKIAVIKLKLDLSYTHLLFLCIMGIGLFSYFQARGRDGHFMFVAPTSFFVIAVLIENASKYFPRYGVDKKYVEAVPWREGASVLIVLFLLFIQPFGTLLSFRTVRENFNTHVEWLSHRLDDGWVNEVLPLLDENEELIIVAPISEAYISSRLNRSCAISGFSQLGLTSVEGVEIFQRDLRSSSGIKVFVDMTSMHIRVQRSLETLDEKNYYMLWTNEQFALFEPSG